MDPNAPQPDWAAAFRQLQARLDAVTADNAGLRERVRKLEMQAGIAPITPVRKAPPPPMVYPAAPPAAMMPPLPPAPPQMVPPPLPAGAPAAGAMPPPPLPPGVVPPPMPAAHAAPREGVETQVGLTWINRIAAVTLILGAAFFFKYAVDNDWVGPTGRVILGLIAALGAIAFGDRLWRKQQQIFAQGLFALGIVLLYLSFWAAFSLYHLVPQSVAFALLCVATAASGAMSLRYNHSFIAILGLCGGYATPFLVSTGTPNDPVLLGYLLVLNIVTMWLGRLQNWRVLQILNALASGLIHAAWAEERLSHFRVPGLLFLTANYAVFALMATTPLAAYVAHFAINIQVAISIGRERDEYLAFALLLAAACCAWSERLITNRATWRGAATVAFLAWWAARALWDGHPPVPIELAAQGGFVALIISWTLWRGLRRDLQFHAEDLTTFAVAGAAYLSVGLTRLQDDYAGYRGLFTAALAAVYLGVAYFLRQRATAQASSSPAPLLAAGLALSLVTLALPLQFTGFRVTMAWAIEMAIVAFLAHRLNHKLLTVGSWLIALLVLLRLVAEDAWTYYQPTFQLGVNARFLTFLASTIALWMTAYWNRRTPWLEKSPAPVLPYVLGHALLLWALHLEAWDYVYTRPGLAQSQLYTLISSILLGAYGFLLVAAGVAGRSVLNRILGLLLFAAVIIKLYIYDVWLLNQGFRIIAFAALGLLLLAGSYLYSRYRSKIEGLFKEAPAMPPSPPPQEPVA